MVQDGVEDFFTAAHGTGGIRANPQNVLTDGVVVEEGVKFDYTVDICQGGGQYSSDEG